MTAFASCKESRVAEYGRLAKTTERRCVAQAPRFGKRSAAQYFVWRDLLEEDVGPVKMLWELPRVQKILNKQREEGSWKYPASKKEIRSQRSYGMLQTHKMLIELVEKYGFSKGCGHTERRHLLLHLPDGRGGLSRHLSQPVQSQLQRSHHGNPDQGGLPR